MENSVEYCMLPQYVNSDNMFDGWQYYQTTMHLLGMKEAYSPIMNGRFYNYNNKVFSGTIGYESCSIYGNLIRMVEYNNEKYYACNDLKKANIPWYNEFIVETGVEHPTSYDLERWMFKKIYETILN